MIICATLEPHVSTQSVLIAAYIYWCVIINPWLVSSQARRALGAEGHTRTACIELRVSNQIVLIPAYIYWCDIINSWLVYRAEGHTRTACDIRTTHRPEGP